MELAPRLEGVIPVLPVPFADDQSLDLAAFAAEVRWALERPIDGLALFGLASEYWKFDDQERIALTETLVATVERRRPVLVSVTDSTRYHAERFARRVADLGADALVVMPPHFMSPRADKVIDHCRAVADAVAPRPVVIQYSPAYIGVALSAEVFVRMQEQSPNIGYVKVEPRPPGPMVEAIRRASDGRLACLIGQGGLTLADCRRRGIAGLMPGIAVVEIYRTLWNGLAADPVSSETLELNDRMVTMMSHIVPTIDMWVAAEKQLLAWRGVIDRPLLRDPSSTPEPGFFDYLRVCYERLKPYLEPPHPCPSPARGEGFWDGHSTT
jgi:4-hydroxy-tetrahydrodipicolinate synthase